LIQPSENSYGLPWRAGDFVTCCIDLEDGTMGYWLNGEPMGIAFTNINKKEEWYPVCLLMRYECLFSITQTKYVIGCIIGLVSRVRSTFRWGI